MNIVIGSIFRNSVGYLPRYFGQMDRLRVMLKRLDHELHLVLVEGDSIDDTYRALKHMSSTYPTTLVKRDHGGPMWGSVDQPERWAALAWCCNAVLENVMLDAGAVIYVESDLIWDPETMLKVLSHLREVPAVATMCFTREGAFYDIWGHMKDGQNFGPFPPYHHGLKQYGLTEIDSAGSCIGMRGEVARRARFGLSDCVRGLGRSIRENGYSLWIDPQLKVVHP